MWRAEDGIESPWVCLKGSGISEDEGGVSAGPFSLGPLIICVFVYGRSDKFASQPR